MRGPSVTIVDPYDLHTEVTGFVANTEYWFLISAKCRDGVLATDSVMYYFIPITTASAGPDLAGCAGTSVITLQGNEPGINEAGLWQVVGENNGVTIDNPTAWNSTVSLASGSCGLTVLRWTITGTNSCIDFDDMIIYHRGGVSPVDAGSTINVNGCYSTTTSTDLSASSGGCGINGQQGEWTFISGPSIPVFGNINSASSSLSNLVEGTYIVKWTVSGPCVNGSDYDTIVVAAPLGSVTSANAGSDQIFCDSRTSFTLIGNNPIFAGDSGLWEQTTSRSGVTIINPTSPVTAVNVTDPTGVYTFRYTIRNTTTNCSSSSSVTITYRDNPTITLTADPLIPCNDSLAIVTYNWTGIGVVQWSLVSGPTNWLYNSFPTGWTNATSSPQYIYNLSGTGTYMIRMRVFTGTGNGCTSVSEDIPVTTSKTPNGSNAGSDVVLPCDADTANLSGSTPDPLGTWSAGACCPTVPVFSDIHDPHAVVTNLVPGAYRLRWTVSGGPACPPVSDDMRIILADTIPSQAEAGPDTTVCHDFPLQLQGNSPLQNEWGYWTVEPAGPQFIPDSSAARPVIAGLDSNNVYTFVWRHVNRCGMTSDTMQVTVSNDISPNQAIAGPDQCLSTGTTSVVLEGNDPLPYAGYWAQVSGPTLATFADSSAYLTLAGNLVDGTYLFEWVNYYTFCGVTRDTVEITIAPALTIADAGADVDVCGTTYQLNGNTPGAMETGLWEQISGPLGVAFDDPSLPDATLSDLAEGTYEFRWTISNGACASSWALITLRVSIPPSRSEDHTFEFQ